MLKTELVNPKNYIFGSTAAIITNISLIVGLETARSGKGPILGGLLTIALADNISDSLGIHMYKETEGATARLTVLATVLNFTARLLISLSFIAIVLLCSAPRAVPAAVVWGLVLIAGGSFWIARRNRENVLVETVKHLLVALVVILLSHAVGHLIAVYF
ncbi:MAG TPA: hypothetical protein VMF29_03275 [Candidatus Edwardsbacteria bacterium]|nr:hypothetical protein [Candidatus Edwardsbacteria bacterium]